MKVEWKENAKQIWMIRFEANDAAAGAERESKQATDCPLKPGKKEIILAPLALSPNANGNGRQRKESVFAI